VAGFVAPRHLKAVKDTGHRLVAALDPHDAVGILDKYAFDVKFFKEAERFERHLEKLRRGPAAGHVDYVTVCSPNYLHDSHIRLGLRSGAHVLCEKPLVINPWNLDGLQEIEQQSGKRVSTVLQLRLHPQLIALHKALASARPKDLHDVTLTYVTARGSWYDVSWKGSEERSGGLVTNIGIHFFDLLLWLFGGVTRCEVHARESRRLSGYLELERARVKWFLSAESSDLPFTPEPGVKTTFRSITVDGQDVEFSEGFGDLHTRVYEEVLAGRGFGIADSRPSIELSDRIRQTRAEPVAARLHSMSKAR